jgi:hypothetical protein
LAQARLRSHVESTADREHGGRSIVR